MGYNEKVVGGGSAKALAGDFTRFLQGFMQSGQFSSPGKYDPFNSTLGKIAGVSGKGGVGGAGAGSQFQDANPANQSADIFGLLNSLISNPAADAGVQELINKDIERGRNDLRSKFGTGGGMGFGTPAAFAEAMYQAEQAPRTAVAMDQMAQSRLGALMPIFNAILQMSALGTPQAQAALQPSGAMQGFNLLMDIANTGANFLPTPKGGSTDSRKPETYSGSGRA